MSTTAMLKQTLAGMHLGMGFGASKRRAADDRRIDRRTGPKAYFQRINEV